MKELRACPLKMEMTTPQLKMVMEVTEIKKTLAGFLIRLKFLPVILKRNCPDINSGNPESSTCFPVFAEVQTGVLKFLRLHSDQSKHA